MQTRAAVASQERRGRMVQGKPRQGVLRSQNRWGTVGVTVGVPKIDTLRNHDKNKEEKEMLMLMLVLPWLAMTMFYKHLQVLTTMFFWLDADSGGWGDTFASSLPYFSLLFSHTDFD